MTFQQSEALPPVKLDNEPRTVEPIRLLFLSTGEYVCCRSCGSQFLDGGSNWQVHLRQVESNVYGGSLEEVAIASGTSCARVPTNTDLMLCISEVGAHSHWRVACKGISQHGNCLHMSSCHTQSPLKELTNQFPPYTCTFSGEGRVQLT